MKLNLVQPQSFARHVFFNSNHCRRTNVSFCRALCDAERDGNQSSKKTCRKEERKDEMLTAMPTLRCCSNRPLISLNPLPGVWSLERGG